MQFGGLHNPAKELRVNEWIDGNGQLMDRPLRLADFGDGYKIIYCFQHWCSGCHARGFPTLKSSCSISSRASSSEAMGGPLPPMAWP